MSEPHPNPENPYAAPQLAQAELVSPVDPMALGPGEMPCHRCGQPVPAKLVKCPRCGASPLYDRLELLITAVLVFAVLIAVQLGFLFRLVDGQNSWFFLILGLVMAAVLLSVRWNFKKLRRGRW